MDALVGERVMILMFRKRISQVAMARQLRIDQSALSRKLRGERAWSVDDLRQVALLLKIPLSDLLPGPEELPHLDSNQKPFGTRSAA